MSRNLSRRLPLDAEALYAELLRGVRMLCDTSATTASATATHIPCLAGIASGGAWLAERLHRDLGLPHSPGVLSSSLHRDDFARRGMAASAHTTLPFDVNGADILVLDDVLYTGRTIRAVLNELFDYGRPARVRLAVLVEREGRELPVTAQFAATRVSLPATQTLALAQTENGRFHFHLQDNQQA